MQVIVLQCIIIHIYVIGLRYEKESQPKTGPQLVQLLIYNSKE